MRSDREIGLALPACTLCGERAPIRKLVRKEYVLSGAHSKKAKLAKASVAQGMAEHSKATLVMAGLVLLHDLPGDPLDKLHRQMYLQRVVGTAQAPAAEYVPLAAEWFALISAGEQAWKVFQAVLCRCGVRGYPHWARSLSRETAPRSFRLHDAFKLFGAHALYSALLQYVHGREYMPLPLWEYLEKMQELSAKNRLPRLDEAKRMAALSFLFRLQPAGYQRWQIFSAAYKLHERCDVFNRGNRHYWAQPEQPGLIEIVPSFRSARAILRDHFIKALILAFHQVNDCKWREQRRDQVEPGTPPDYWQGPRPPVPASSSPAPPVPAGPSGPVATARSPCAGSDDEFPADAFEGGEVIPSEDGLLAETERMLDAMSARLKRKQSWKEEFYRRYARDITDDRQKAFKDVEELARLLGLYFAKHPRLRKCKCWLQLRRQRHPALALLPPHLQQDAKKKPKPTKPAVAPAELAAIVDTTATDAPAELDVIDDATPAELDATAPPAELDAIVSATPAELDAIVGATPAELDAIDTPAALDATPAPAGVAGPEWRRLEAMVACLADCDRTALHELAAARGLVDSTGHIHQSMDKDDFDYMRSAAMQALQRTASPPGWNIDAADQVADAAQQSENDIFADVAMAIELELSEVSAAPSALDQMFESLVDSLAEA